MGIELQPTNQTRKVEIFKKTEEKLSTELMGKLEAKQTKLNLIHRRSLAKSSQRFPLLNELTQVLVGICRRLTESTFEYNLLT